MWHPHAHNVAMNHVAVKHVAVSTGIVDIGLINTAAGTLPISISTLPHTGATVRTVPEGS